MIIIENLWLLSLYNTESDYVIKNTPFYVYFYGILRENGKKAKLLEKCLALNKLLPICSIF